MKKLVLVFIIVCLVAGMVFAQNWGNGWGSAPQTISVTGTLQLRNGVIAVVSGNSAYYVPVLTRYIGFIEGLREDAQISIEGFVFGNQIQPDKITLNGKAYDFTVNAQQGYACCGNGWGNSRAGYGRGAWGYQAGGYGCWW